MEKKKAILEVTMVLLSLLVMSTVVPLVSAQTTVTIKGKVTFEDGSGVGNGLLVNVTNLKTGSLLGSQETTVDSMYIIATELSDLSQKDVLEATAKDASCCGRAIHIVTEEDLADKLIWMNITVSTDMKAPTIEFISPTPANNAEIAENYVVINVTASDEEHDISHVWLDWNGTDYTMFVTGSINENLYVFTYNVTNLTKGVYTYTVYANDTTSCGNTGASETRKVIVNVPTEVFELPLAEGWNLISIPLEVTNTSIDAVFPDATDGDELYGYNNGSWVSAKYYSALPGWYGDLKSIVPDKGYWYHANSAYTAIINGIVAGSRSVDIIRGWNLVGYTKLNKANITELIPNASDGDEIYGYNEGWKSTTYYSTLPGWYGDLSTMEPGRGYWYHANAPFSWEY